jgi:hypothetical protein
MAIQVDSFRNEGGSVSPGGTITLTFKVVGFTGQFYATYIGNGVTLDGAGTQVRTHNVTSSSQIITDTFTVVGSQGTHSINLIPTADMGSAYEYSVSFYLA